jgi:RNA polymerase sigma-70 factor (ECF subfamily)
MNSSTVAVAPVKSPSAEDEERELSAAFARGEPWAFERLVDCYQYRVAALAHRLLAWGDGAEDIAQDVFLAALAHQKRFRRESSLWTYLATVTVNRCRSLRRRRWLHDRVVRALDSGLKVVEASETPAICDEVASCVRLAVGRLPDKYREAIVLRYLEGMSVTEMADVLGLARNAIEVRLSRARKLLEPELAHLVEE